MPYDFDTEISRKDSQSVKWGMMQDPDDPKVVRETDRFFGEGRTLPMWVADMDFRCPQPVIDALTARAAHGIYGYTFKPDSYFEAVIGWMKRRHGWVIEKDWIMTTGGVVPALMFVVRTFVPPGKKVLIQPPSYYPFTMAVENNGGVVAHNPLKFVNGRYEMDFDDLEVKASDPDVVMAIISNPHNPIGRVWSKDEMTRLAEICTRHEVLIVSDEIHGDLVYQRGAFTPLGMISEAFARNSITCTAPSKSFNLAGLQASNLIIANPEHREKFQKTLDSSAHTLMNSFAVVAVEAAYNHGEEWLEELLKYLSGNLDTLEAFVKEHLPEIDVIRPEGTYLAWLDCRRLGLDDQALKELMLNKARVYMDEGYIFGPEGSGFERMNVACPRSILVEALERIRAAVGD